MKIKVLLLSAGQGKRLKPLTNLWPKPLMPIKGRPLLEYLICILCSLNIKNILINIHHHKEIMLSFLKRSQINKNIKYVYEPNLLGTCGTLLKNKDYFKGSTILFIHADNWCNCDLKDFINFHFLKRKPNILMTMMTFRTDKPSMCGIVETNEEGVVVKFHEKIKNPPGNLANASIYLIEPEIYNLLDELDIVTDFDIDVIPHLLGKIQTWENIGILRDIGTLESLTRAQSDKIPNIHLFTNDEWTNKFKKSIIYNKIQNLLKNNLNNFIGY